ncbi:MAG TPA: diguanylate cyclase [Ilumatobacteraceae bacterium]|nr:diguanylate cyclase [Ilumatobacteraceae bacterium]
MTSSTGALTGRSPEAVLDAMRSLLWLKTTAAARLAAETLVRQLGGSVVPADAPNNTVVPADLSFGDGEPVFASASAGSDARAHLDRYLVPFLFDARRALELSARLDRLDEEASTDRLTSLPNRRTMDRVLGRLGADGIVIMFDLDHFKNVNDELGHHTGDQVLQAFGTALQSVVRAGEIAGRFGGEEFVAVISSPDGANSLLERLRTTWEATRPLPVTFSAGIARSAGTPAMTLRMADAALYEAKEAGRDRWVWSQTDELPQPSSDAQPCASVDEYVTDAVNGERRSAIRTTLDMFDSGVPQNRVIVELLAAGQREVGERWHRNQLTVADEHVATGVSAAALDALVSEVDEPAGDGHTMVVCAEGDWHSLAAQMFGESLRSLGVGVTILGASTPGPYVAELLARRGADSLAISCSLAIHFPGVIKLIDIAHEQGLPVVVGGRALGADGTRAARLGADAWAETADEAAVILQQWRIEGAPGQRTAASPDVRALHMMDHATAIAQASFAELAAEFPPMAAYNSDQIARTHEDLAFNVQFLAAAVLTSDSTVFTEYLDWLRTLLDSRGVPGTALPAGLSALRPIVEQNYPDALAILDAGRRLLITA